MPTAPPSPTTSLRPRLGADRTPVYGGRVIAESEEEYSNLQTTVMNPGLVDPGQTLPLQAESVASGMEHGGQVGAYRIVQSTTAHMPYLQGQSDEHQLVDKVSVMNPSSQFSSIQERGKIVRYPGSNFDGPNPGGLRRNIRDNCPMPIHGPVHGQLMQHQHASLYQNQQAHASYLHSRGTHCSVDCSTLPVQSESIAQPIQRSHSLPTRDPRIFHHNSLGRENPVYLQGSVHRDVNLLKSHDKSLGSLQVIYSSQQQQQQQQQQQALPHPGISSIVPTDRVVAQQSTDASHGVLALDSVRSLPIPPSSISGLEECIENRIVPSVTVSMDHIQAQKSAAPIQPITFHVPNHNRKSAEASLSVTPTLNKVVGLTNGNVNSGKIGVGGNCEERREHQLTVGIMKQLHTFSQPKSHHRALYQSSEDFSVTQEPLPVQFVDRQAIALPVDMHPRPLQRALSKNVSCAGFSYVQPQESIQLPSKPRSLSTDSSPMVQLCDSSKDEAPFGCEPPDIIWSPLPHAGQKRREKPWNGSGCQREGKKKVLQDEIKMVNESGEGQKCIMLDIEHPLCENDEILRPFGNPVATDDFFGEGFPLDSTLPVSGPFAATRAASTDPRTDSHNDCQGLATSSQLEAPSSLHEAHEAFSGAHFPQRICDQQGENPEWQDRFLETVHGKSSNVSHNDIWDSDDEDASPTISLKLSLEDLREVSDMHADSACAGDIHDEILGEKEEHLCPEQEDSVEFSRGGVEDDDDEITEEEDFNAGAVDEVVGLKCPRLSHRASGLRIKHQSSSPTQTVQSKASRAARRNQKQSSKSKKSNGRATRLPAKKKLPSEIDAFLASVGLGFSNDEVKRLPKTPPRFPRKMAVKKEDVLQLAISMTGNPAASANEIQEICVWWMHQAEAETAPASRAHVLTNWHGLKIASSFADGPKGLAAIQKCMENDDRFVLCGPSSEGHDLWGICDGVKSTSGVEERRSDSDEKTIFSTSEQDDWRAKEEVSHISADEVAGQRRLVYHKVAQDEFKRRQTLQRLQSSLECGGCSDQDKDCVLSSIHKYSKQSAALSEEQQQESWAEPEDTQSLNNSPSRKRPRTNREYLSRSCKKQVYGVSQSLIKHKTRRLSDVYAHGPKILKGNDSPVTLPDQELDSKAGGGNVNSSVLMEFEGHTTEKEGCYGISSWVHNSDGIYPVGSEVDQEFPTDFLPEKLSESEQGNLLELLPACEGPEVFENPDPYATSSVHDAVNTRLHRDGLLHEKSSSRLVNPHLDLVPAALQEARFC